MRNFFYLLAGMLLLFSNMSFAQQEVTGKVTDANGAPLPGATITIKKVKGGTVAASDGTFKINAPANAVLVISAVGFESKEVSIGSQTNISVILVNDTKSLNEVVVTSGGIRREKKALGYAVSTVGKKDLELRPDGDIARVLTGKAAGVNILNTSGLSGSGTNITIRAISTITGNSTPLFVVDGVPFDGGTNSATNFTYGNQTSSRFLDLDPNNIESVSVLKGLSATTLYGELGRNGVILITTKNGSGSKANKKSEISVSQSYFTNTISNLPEYNTKYGGGFDLSNGVAFFSNWGGPFSDPPIAVPHPYDRSALWAAFPQFIGAPYYYKQYKNNVKDFFRTGNISTTSVNIGGSGSNGNYNASFGYLDDKGIVLNNGVKKMNFGLGGSSKLSNNFTISGTFNFVTTKVEAPPTSTSFGSSATNTSVFGDVMYTPTSVDLQHLPWESPLDHSQVYYRSNNGIQNPIWTLHNSFTQDNSDRFYGNLQLKYDITKHLNLSYRVGFDKYAEFQLYAQNKGGSYTPDGIMRTLNGTNSIWDQTLIANYNRNLGTDFTLGVDAGVNVRNDNYTQTGITSSKQLVFGLLNHANFIDHQSRSEAGGEMDYKSELETVGAFAFSTLGYKEYVFLNLGGRESWSSALEKNNRNLFYPSASLSFIPTSFIETLKNSRNVNYIKLRVAYGTSAEFPDPYRTRPSLGISTKSFVDVTNTAINTNYVSGTLPNPNLKPSLLKEIELGIEGRFIDNRVTLDLTYYNRNAKDQILNRDLDPSTGYSVQTINAGNVRNKGIELGLGYTVVRNKDWRWQLDGLFTKNKSKVSDIPSDLKQIVTAGFTNLGTFAINGQPLGVIQGYAYERLDGQKLVNAIGDYTIANDISILGDPNPDYKVTGITSVSYKSITLRVQMEYSKGGAFYSSTSSVLLGRGVTRDTEFDRALPYILPGIKADKTPNNIQISATQAYFDNTVAGGSADEAGIYDGTNIRIREASLSYSLPQNWIKKLPIGAVSLSVSGTNLWYYAPNFPKYVHFDPETSGLGVANGRGLEFFTGPSTRRIGGSIRVTF